MGSSNNLSIFNDNSTNGHFSDGFGFVTDSCTYIQDNKRDGFALSDSDDPEGKAERWGKAYLQRLYDDLSERWLSIL